MTRFIRLRAGSPSVSENAEPLEPPRALSEAAHSALAPPAARNWTGEPLPSTAPSREGWWLCERLIERGADSLGDTFADYELMGMILYLAQPDQEFTVFAKAAIEHFGSFARVLTASSRELSALPGMNARAVAAIRLVQSAAVRLARAEVMDRPIFKNWDRLLAYLHAILAREKTEHLRILFLDNKNRLLADEAHVRGTVNHTPVYPREIVKRALELHATAMILVHNHPSGDPTPSAEDIAMTREVRAAGQGLGIVLQDHIIIGNGRWVSFRKEGLI